jgi:apolipoprotein D and lipocalin family protein
MKRWWSSTHKPLRIAESTAVAATGSAIPQNVYEARAENYVDLDRFMGEWYVIASIPTVAKKNICNATETYQREVDGSIAVTFSFYKGSFDGKQKIYRPRGIVRDASNAEWGMQLIWPIMSDYRIVFVDEDYSQAVIGRNSGDYASILARTPTISHEDLFERVRILREKGYNTHKLQLVPQSWDGSVSSYSAGTGRGLPI